jgi:hypothetical protein
MSLGVLNAHSAQQGSFVIEWSCVEYTHEEYWNMLLTQGACNTEDRTAAREYALRHLGWRHPDANVFRLLEQRLRETGSVTPTALVNAGRPRAVRTLAKEYAIIAAVKREPWRCSCDIVWELGPSKYVITLNCFQTTTCGVHICFQMIVLHACNFANGHDIKTLWWDLFTQHSVDRQSVFYAWGCVKCPQYTWTLDWTRRVDCMASLVDRSNCDGFSPVGTPKGVRLRSPSQDYWRSRGKTLRSCDNVRCQHVKARSRSVVYKLFSSRNTISKYNYHPQHKLIYLFTSFILRIYTYSIETY